MSKDPAAAPELGNLRTTVTSPLEIRPRRLPKQFPSPTNMYFRGSQIGHGQS